MVLICLYRIPLLNKYREMTSGRLQVLCQIFPKGLLAFLANPVLTGETVREFLSDIDEAADRGAVRACLDPELGFFLSAAMSAATARQAKAPSPGS